MVDNVAMVTRVQVLLPLLISFSLGYAYGSGIAGLLNRVLESDILSPWFLLSHELGELRQIIKPSLFVVLRKRC